MKSTRRLHKKGSKSKVSTILNWAGLSDAWEMAELAVKKSSRVLLIGPPGIGKSYLGTKLDAKFYQVSLSEDLSVQELMGHFVPEGSLFRWHHGPIVRAMLEGCVLIINEIPRASTAVQDFLLGVLDDPDICSIALPNGERIKPITGFRVVATSNSDISVLDLALQDRFEVFIHLPGPNPELIKRLDKIAQGLGALIADSYRDPAKAFSPRRAIALAKLLDDGVKLNQAAVMTFGNRATDFVQVARVRGVKIG